MSSESELDPVLAENLANRRQLEATRADDEVWEQEQAKLAAEQAERDRLYAEEKARADAEEKLRLEAILKSKQEADEKARKEAEARKRAEAEQLQRMEDARRKA